MDKAGHRGSDGEDSDLARNEGRDPFKLRADTKAARSIEKFGGNLATSKRKTLEKNRASKAIAAKSRSWWNTGSLRFCEDLRSEFQAEILELLRFRLGQKGQGACMRGRVSRLPAPGGLRAGRVAELPLRKKRQKTWPAIANEPSTRIVSLGASRQAETRGGSARRSGRDHVCIAGSYRRKKEIFGTLISSWPTSAPAGDTAICATPIGRSVIGRGRKLSGVRLRPNQCDLRGERDGVPFELIILPGAKSTQSRAKPRPPKRWRE